MKREQTGDRQGKWGETQPKLAADASVRQLRQINLDLLPLLHELLRTRSLSRTARSLGITQPSVSKALRELRSVFGDDLLMSLGRNARLTERAEALVDPLQRILDEVRELVIPAKAFEPAIEHLTFSVAAVDYVSALLAPRLTIICGREAPGVRFVFVDAAIRKPEDLARVDFLVVPRAHGELLGKRVDRAPLWRDDYVCIAADDGRSLPDPMTPEAFTKLRHVGYQMRPGGPSTGIAQILPPSALEVARICTVSDFLVLCILAETTDCVALVPRKLAEMFRRQRAIRVIELDGVPRHIDIDVHWIPGLAGRRGHSWFRKAILRAAAEIG